MTKQPDDSKERSIWEFYQQKCKLEGTKPSVQGFKEWTAALLKDLK